MAGLAAGLPVRRGPSGGVVAGRRSRVPALAIVDVASPPAADAFDVALARLAEIERPDWSARGDVARHYEAVTDALRDYLEAADGSPGPRAHHVRALLVAAAPHLSEGSARRYAAVFERGRPGQVRATPARPQRPPAFLDERAGCWAAGGSDPGAGRRRMRFADPALPAPAPGAGRRCGWRAGAARRRARAERIGFPGLVFLAGAPATVERGGRGCRKRSGSLGLALLIVALARPQVPHEVRQIHSKSRNIMVALDISSSMKAGDFKPGNRLMVARQVLADFVSERNGDLLGLVIFAGRAFLQAPLTPDADLLHRMLGRIDIGMLPDGTAIGTALAMCLTQLKDLPPEGERHRAHHRRRQQHRPAVAARGRRGGAGDRRPHPHHRRERGRHHGAGQAVHLALGRTRAGPAQQRRRGDPQADQRPQRREVLPRDRPRGAAGDPDARSIRSSGGTSESARPATTASCTPTPLAPGLVLLAAGLLLGATRLRSVP